MPPRTPRTKRRSRQGRAAVVDFDSVEDVELEVIARHSKVVTLPRRPGRDQARRAGLLDWSRQRVFNAGMTATSLVLWVGFVIGQAPQAAPAPTPRAAKAVEAFRA